MTSEARVRMSRPGPELCAASNAQAVLSNGTLWWVDVLTGKAALLGTGLFQHTDPSTDCGNQDTAPAPSGSSRHARSNHRGTGLLAAQPATGRHVADRGPRGRVRPALVVGTQGLHPRAEKAILNAHVDMTLCNQSWPRKRGEQRGQRAMPRSWAVFVSDTVQDQARFADPCGCAKPAQALGTLREGPGDLAVLSGEFQKFKLESPSNEGFRSRTGLYPAAYVGADRD